MDPNAKLSNPCCADHVARLKRLANAKEALERAVDTMKLQVQSMEAALEASRARRGRLLAIARILVLAEDSPKLTDAEWNVMLDRAVRRSRTELDLERRDQERQKGGAR